MSRTIETVTNSAVIGDVLGGNYTEFEPDGTRVAKGAATVWEDLVNSLIGKKLFSNTGTVDYDYDNNAIKFQPGGTIADAKDVVNWNYQKLHGIKAISDMMLHIHLRQSTANKVVFELDYRIQKNNAVWATAWETLTCNTTDDAVFTYPGTGNFNQILIFPAIDLTGTNVSDIVQFKMTRTDATTGNVLATYVDAHCEFDTDGSRTEWAK